MNKRLINRRQFSARCAALGMSLPIISALCAEQTAGPGSDSGIASRSSTRTVRLPDGASVPALGQGCWHLGQGRHAAVVEEEALQIGISLGMTLIDTSGNYGGGRSEEFLNHVIATRRERIFLVTKVEAGEVSGDGIARACAASLARLGSGYIDLYLLHWPVPSAQFAEVVAAFELLRAVGKIRAWGVSNFDVAQMEELLRVPDGHRCATNQVAYSLNDRRVESELLPWCQQQRVPVMAYSPLGGDHHLVIANGTLAKLAMLHRCSPAAIALAWATRSGNVIAIPESGSPEHARENAAALTMTLSTQDLQALDLAFPKPLGTS